MFKIGDKVRIIDVDKVTRSESHKVFIETVKANNDRFVIVEPIGKLKEAIKLSKLMYISVVALSIDYEGETHYILIEEKDLELRE